MKKTIIYIILWALTLSGCVVNQDGDPAGGQPVRLTLSTATRSGGAALHDDADFSVSTLRVLGYGTTTGRLAFNCPVTSFTDTTDPQTPQEILRTARIDVKKGRFDFVIIANEGSDPALAALLADNSAIQSIGVLRGMGFGHSAFDAGLDIPMVSFYSDVEVVGDDSIVAPAPTGAVNGTWSIGLERLAVRAEITLSLTPAQFARWTAWKSSTTEDKFTVSVDNVPEKVYLAAGSDNSDAVVQEPVGYEARSGNDSYTSAPGNIATLLDSDGVTVLGYEVTFPRIILPEKYFSDPSDASRAMVLQVTFSDGIVNRTLSGPIGSLLSGAAAGRDYTLPRNTYLAVSAAVDDSTPEAEFTIRASVEDWTTAAFDDIEVL